ncbi:MAG: ATP-binding protein [Planctomycetes bacterium]|nr:ATP-binding protein [Planctomycetota bacterium]NOG54174.1 hypothetical protein [Planctomycetota bacterium]
MPNWNLKRLQEFVDAATSERFDVEFKAPEKLTDNKRGKQEISRIAAGMANGAGGLLIVGVHEDKSSTPPVYTLGPGIAKDSKYTAEWLHSVFRMHIKPPLNTLVIEHVDLEDGTVALVAEVPRATLEPRQASDKRYPIRRGDATVDMDHDEIRYAFFRERKAQLCGVIALMDGSFDGAGPDTKIFKTRHTLTIRNIGATAASSYKVELVNADSAVKEFDEGPHGRKFTASGRKAIGYRFEQALFPGDSRNVRVVLRWGTVTILNWAESLTKWRNAQFDWRILTDADLAQSGAICGSDLIPDVDPDFDAVVSRDNRMWASTSKEVSIGKIDAESTVLS